MLSNNIIVLSETGVNCMKANKNFGTYLRKFSNYSKTKL
jgi:hypothetical protein